uniref:serine/threonine-protein kinase STE20-like n=1 Tax=Styela clava TaxID=7725 RepID=UPI00193AB0D9|nr:serine/threonine-protein kinase STE20-like [Styela clava]
MSADPVSFPFPSFYNHQFLPYSRPNFWLNFAQPELCIGEGNMASQGNYVTSNVNNDALVVYDARQSSGVARCLKINADRVPKEIPTSDAFIMTPQGLLPSEYQLFGISNPNPLDIYATGLSSHGSGSSVSSSVGSQDPTHSGSNVMPKPLHRVPTVRQQHYHQRHHAQAKHPQANNLKNKTRFSATGLSSNYMVVRDTKMSLSSAPSSPSAGSVGGSLGNNYHLPPTHLPDSNAYYRQQYKGSSSSSSCCSNSGLKISSSSQSSYSSCSSLSSSPSVNGISPRKRRADDVINNNREAYCRKEYYYRQGPGGQIITLCSCEVCATDEVTARVDDVTIRDSRTTEEHGQQQKRSKNDDDVVFVSAQLPRPQQSPNIPIPKERPARKAKKSSRKAVNRAAPVAQNATSHNNFPFVVPTTTSSEFSDQQKDNVGRYYLRSAVKGRKQEEMVVKYATDVQVQHENIHLVQSIVAPVVAQSDQNNNAEAQRHYNKGTVGNNTPRYHTRSQQKKAKADNKSKVRNQKSDVQQHSNAQYNHVIVATETNPSAAPNTSSSSVQQVPECKAQAQQYVPTSTESSPAAEGSKDTPRSSSSLKKLYDIHGIIGVGGGGTVYAGTRKADGVQVAIKQVPKAKVKRWGKLNDRVVPIEFELLYRASHERHTGIINMLDWYERRSTYILIMERPQPVIDLFDYLNQYGALPEANARAIFRQIAEAVIHCHANGVVHRDIKDENVLLNLHTSEAKLIDFGCGTVLKNTPYTEFAGTPEFYPPEWFTHRRYYGHRVDAWSLGVLLYTMVEAEVPFQKEKDIVECNLRHKRAAHLSDSCKHLIAWMLQKDQDMRPTIEQALAHPWFQECETVPPRNTPASKAVASGVMGTDELYEKRLHNHQNGTNAASKGAGTCHEVASVESPESPPRYIAQETVLYQPQTTNCQAAHRNGVVYHQTEYAAR